MARIGKRVHEAVDAYEEDDFVENNDGSAAPKSKKSKKGQTGKGPQADKHWEVILSILRLPL